MRQNAKILSDLQSQKSSSTYRHNGEVSGYWGYLLQVDRKKSAESNGANAIAPAGPGAKLWPLDEPWVILPFFNQIPKKQGALSRQELVGFQ